MLRSRNSGAVKSRWPEFLKPAAPPEPSRAGGGRRPRTRRREKRAAPSCNQIPPEQFLGTDESGVRTGRLLKTAHAFCAGLRSLASLALTGLRWRRDIGTRFPPHTLLAPTLVFVEPENGVSQYSQSWKPERALSDWLSHGRRLISNCRPISNDRLQTGRARSSDSTARF